MQYKQKLSIEQKVEIVQEYLKGQISDEYQKYFQTVQKD